MWNFLLVKIYVSRADRFTSVDLPKLLWNDDFTMEQQLLLIVQWWLFAFYFYAMFWPIFCVWLYVFQYIYDCVMYGGLIPVVFCELWPKNFFGADMIILMALFCTSSIVSVFFCAVSSKIAEQYIRIGRTRIYWQ